MLLPFLKKTKKTEIRPLAFGWYIWPLAIVCLAGLLDSIYLAYSHYRVYTDISYKSFCAISKAFNCDTVSQSPYSIFLGFPVPLWGFFGYCFFGILIFFSSLKSAQHKRIFPLMLIIAIIFCGYSLVLAFISSFIIHSYCIMCIVSYGVNLLLLFYVWIIRRRFSPDESLVNGIKNDIVFIHSRKKSILPVISAFFLCFGAAYASVPEYWKTRIPPITSEIDRGVTPDGHPWIGARKPRLTIEEFTDYRCFQCKKMHRYLRDLIAVNPDKIRLIHRHFPLDKRYNPIVREQIHPGSGDLSLFAIYAQTQGKFWEANDLIYGIPQDTREVNLKKLAEKIGIDLRGAVFSRRDRKLIQLLLKDIYDGLKKGVTKTPSFLINEKLYEGNIPPEILKRYFD